MATGYLASVGFGVMRLAQLIQADDPYSFVRDRVTRRINLARQSLGPAAMTPTSALFDRFETLGDTCEFSGLQRAHGVERPALFHWRSTTLAMLTSAIEARLEGYDDPSALNLRIGPPACVGGPKEYVIDNLRWGGAHHTFQFVDQAKPDEVLKREIRKLTLLKRKFLEDAASARRIYVFRSHAPFTVDAVRPLVLALQKLGDNRLLWVRQGAADEASGEVLQVGEGFAVATIDHLTPDTDALNGSSQLWPDLLHATCDLFR